MSFYRSKICFGLVQIFCARPKIYLHIVAVTNILCQCSEIVFCSDTNVFEEAPNAVKFLGCLKKFGPAHNIWLHTHLHIYQVIFKILLTSQHPTHCGRKIKNLGLRVILTKRVAAAANRGTTDRKLEELYGAIFCKLARK